MSAVDTRNNTNMEKYADSLLQHVKSTSLLKTVNHYPVTVEQLKLMVSILDRTNLCEDLDLKKTAQMNEHQLDTFYVILRIMNKMFSIYAEYSVKNILFKKLIKCIPTDHIEPNKYTELSDQLLQDLDYFVCNIANTCSTDSTRIQKQLSVFIKRTLKQDFYRNILTKSSIKEVIPFYDLNDDAIEHISKKFVEYTKTNIMETHMTMKFFLSNIFSDTYTSEPSSDSLSSSDKSQRLVKEIDRSLRKYINLEKLLDEQCSELQIYSEHNLNDENLEQDRDTVIRSKKRVHTKKRLEKKVEKRPQRLRRQEVCI